MSKLSEQYAPHLEDPDPPDYHQMFDQQALTEHARKWMAEKIAKDPNWRGAPPPENEEA